MAYPVGNIFAFLYSYMVQKMKKLYQLVKAIRIIAQFLYHFIVNYALLLPIPA